MAEERLTKDQRRAAAQEVARVMREKQKRRARRNRAFLIGGTTLGILAIFAIVALVLVNSAKPAGPGPANMASDGILITGTADGLKVVENDAIPAGGDPTPTDTDSLTAQLHIVTYLDYLCPFCNQFEATNGAAIQQLIESGTADLEIHPIAILDRSSLGTNYSTRSANAAACVAQYSPDQYLDVNAALFAAQPQEQTAGLSDDDLIDVLSGAGASSDDITTCIRDQTFKAWVSAATTRTLADPDLKNADGNFGTPTVLVNGQRYEGSLTDASEFQAFIGSVFTEAVDGGDGSTPTPTPTPTTPAQ
ncbi:MAG: thioredoxin domain-containing protein [Pseudolysinimonas sp.]